MLADPALSLKFHSSQVEIAKAGDLAYMQGSYTMTMTDPNSKQVINDHGSYVTTYSKQPDGYWKAVADIATSEVPTAAQPGSAPTTKK
jgi:ketosteroid isomerase-like protein